MEFIVKPRKEELYLPTDLLELIPTDYNGNRSDGDIVSALNTPCTKIIQEIRKQGSLDRKSDLIVMREKTSGKEIKLNLVDNAILAAVFSYYSQYPDGLSVHQLFNILGEDDLILSLSLAKLIKIKYLEKIIDSDVNGYSYYTIKVTQDGIDHLLNNKENIIEHIEQYDSRNKDSDKNSDKNIDIDDDIPF